MTLIIALLAGLGAAALAGLLAHSASNVPAEDRTWLDQPPAFIRALWWPTRWLAHLLDPILPARWRARLLKETRAAGLDFMISPPQLLAHGLVTGVACAIAGAMLATLLDLAAGLFVLPGLAAGVLLQQSWRSDRARSRQRQLLKTLPFFLDLITLCVEAGLNLHGALQQAVAKGPAGPLRDEFGRVLRDVRAGKSRTEALRQLADRLDQAPIRNLVSAIIQAESMGMSLGSILRAQSEQRRIERFARAEKSAMEAPVKMLFPLIAFIFPCTFLVLGFPIVVKFMQMGL